MTQLKLEVGRFYKTRSGDKVEVLAILPERNGIRFPVVTYHFSYRQALSYTRKGEFDDVNTLNQNNIISEWQEPVVLERWIVLRDSQIVSCFLENKENLSFAGDADTVLHIKIDLSKPEGQRIWEVVE